MRRFIHLSILSFVICIAAFAQDNAVFIELTDSTLMVFPRECIENQTDDGHVISMQLKGDTTITITKARIKSQNDTYQGEYAKLESFKFNNKYNDQLFTDAVGTIDDENGNVKVSVSCIGKWLTPSFKLSDGAKAYVDGKRQYSKESRLHFVSPMVYTIAWPKQFVYQYKEVAPDVFQKGFIPYGREYEVIVDFLSDHPTTEYGVPRVDITFDDGESWNDYTWIGRYGKTYYEDATIRIDGGGVFPDMPETPMQIRGRGNSSWDDSSNSKNPYRMKFADKVKPFGMTKGRSWVLLGNKMNGSMTTNAIAMKVADMVGSDGCNHIVPVELYINGHYRGSYNFTEKVGFHNNSIDLDDETNAVMLELDQYYDETHKFRDRYYNLYVNIKEPDLDDSESVTNLDEDQIKDAFNSLTSDVKKNYDNALLDVHSLVRAMLVTDLVRNEELMHPKSWFIYNADITADSLWHLGPVWDFDWSFGYERGKNYFITAAEKDLFYYMDSSNIGFPFFKQLLRGSDVVKKEYYRLWTQFMNSGKLEELLDYCDEYFEYVRPSFEHNQDGVTYEEFNWWTGTTYTRTGWGDGSNYATHTVYAKNWLRKRAEFIYKRLTAYDISDESFEQPEIDYDQPTFVDVAKVMSQPVNVYSVNGVLIRRNVPYGQFHLALQPGIYIVNGKKVVIGQ
ncbi:MAG: CotH kinase family protein [Prevotella sp.]|nr:CotH kinase family protein [Prevotella sp.]